VRLFFDTSVLVAAVSLRHVHHQPSLTAYLAATKNQAGCAAHSLAEVYATLTRLPGEQRMSCEQVMLILGDIRERLRIIALDDEEYYAAIDEAAKAGLVGGIIYDAVIARCAIKARATTIYTWNLDHFLRLGSEVANRVRTP
jgi:predicted nucleic acid-binding protein